MNVPSYPTYVRFPSEITDRLSYGDNHPEREAFYATLGKAKRKGFALKPLDSMVTFIEDNVEPAKECPEQTVLYLGLEGIETNTGKAILHSYLGKDIRSVAKRFHRGNIVFADLRPYLNKAHLVQDVEEALGSAELFVILPDKEQVVPQFLLTYLLSDLVLNQTKWSLTGSSYPRLDERDFKKLAVILPTNIDTQTSILNKIKPLTEEAEKEGAAVNHLKDRCRNVILDTLKITLPKPNKFVATNPSYFASSPNDNPERLDLTYHHPWMNEIRRLLGSLKTTKLKELIDPHIDYGITASGKDAGAIPFLNIENIRPDGRLIISNIRYIDSCKETDIAHKGDILLSRSRLVGASGLVTENEDGFSFGSYILRMKVKDDSNIPAEYIVSFLNSDLGQAQIRLLETGSFGKNINTRQLKDIDIVLPSNDNDIARLVTLIVEKWAELNSVESQADSAYLSSRELFVSLLLGH